MENDSSEIFNEIKGYFVGGIKENLKGFMPTPLKTKEDEYASELAAIQANFQIMNDKLMNGWDLISKHAGEIELQNTEEVMESLEDIEKVEEYIENETSFQELFGIPNERMLDFYDVGCKFYTEKNFNDASDIFYLLTVFNSKVNSFWIALANSEWSKKNYQDALLAYLSALNINDKNFQAQYWAARCMVELGQKEEAKELLEDILEIKNEYPEAEEISTMAQQLLNTLR